MNGQELIIEELHAADEHLNELFELLIQVVEEGASVGFLPPLPVSDANAYWASVCESGVILLVAKANDRIAGSVQLHLCGKQNGMHRAEIAKLMTHPAYRRRGIARALMEMAEERARQEGRRLLVLDTREGDPSNQLYVSLGYTRAGRIPSYAQSATGTLDATLLYYKWIG